MHSVLGAQHSLPCDSRGMQRRGRVEVHRLAGRSRHLCAYSATVIVIGTPRTDGGKADGRAKIEGRFAQLQVCTYTLTSVCST